MTQVKICGIQQPEHAIVAAQAGANYIGLVFVPERRRRVELDIARSIVSGLKTYQGKVPQAVGLFADQPLLEVNQAVKECGLDLVQLCGNESLEYAQQMDARVIKVFHVPESGLDDLSALSRGIKKFTDAGHMVTIDRRVDGLQGGTGQTFDWEIAAVLSRNGHEFLLAGGLTPENVAQAVAQVGPWGLDVSSGVETNGVKDPEKIRAFVENARSTRG